MRKQRLSAFFSLPAVLASTVFALIALGVQLSQGQSAGSASSTKTARKGHPAAPASSTAADRTVALAAPTAATVVPPAPLPPPPPPPPPPSPVTTAPDANAVAATSSLAGGIWAQLRQCESTGNYQEDSGNSFYGAYQFTQETWASLGLSGNPAQASPSVQDQAAQRLQARDGWGPWPVCSRKLGLR